MSSPESKKRRLDSDSQEQSTKTPTPQTANVSCDTKDVKEIRQPLKTLLPIRNRKKGRQYIANTSNRRAWYWAHFWEYVENGRRRAECMYCEGKTFAADSHLDGTSNVRKHWLKCPVNLANKSKVRQSKLVFEMNGDGEGKLKVQR